MSLHSIPVLAISASPRNPRKHFDQTAHDELTASISRFGVMQPIIVRPNADGFELVCGERRYRAALAAGLEEVPAIVRDLTDDEAFDLQITENLQRKDINVMEESDAFFALTRRGKTKAKDIAARFGKSERYVYDRLALQQCIVEVQDMLRDGTLPLTHGKQFAKLNLDDQQQLFESLKKNTAGVTLTEIRERISRQFSMVLEDAPFSTMNVDLVPHAGTCLACHKRSGCNQLLFDDVSSKDVCFDKTCYDAKVQAHFNQLQAELEASGMTVHRISLDYYADRDDVLDHHSYDIISKESPEYEECKTVGIIVGVPSWKKDYKPGEVVKIQLDQDEVETENNNDRDDSEDSYEQDNNSASSYVDYDDELSKTVAGKLMDVFDDTGNFNLTTEIELIIAERTYNTVGDCMVKVLHERLKIPFVEDENGYAEDDKNETEFLTFLRASEPRIINGITSILIFLNRFTSGHYGLYSLRNLIQALQAQGIDAEALIGQVEATNNHKFERE